jgi:hypothetical protein
VAHANDALRDELDDVIAAHRPAIDAILRDYGVPLVSDGKMASR